MPGIVAQVDVHDRGLCTGEYDKAEGSISGIAGTAASHPLDLTMEVEVAGVREILAEAGMLTKQTRCHCPTCRGPGMSEQSSAAALRPDAPGERLVSFRLGVLGVVFFVVAAAAPLAAVTGTVPLAIAAGSGAGAPGAYMAIGIILLVFSSGYAAMSQVVTNSGAFFAYVGRGLGLPAGVGAALTSVLAHIGIQLAIYGFFVGLLASQMDALLLVGGRCGYCRRRRRDPGLCRRCGALSTTGIKWDLVGDRAVAGGGRAGTTDRVPFSDITIRPRRHRPRRRRFQYAMGTEPARMDPGRPTPSSFCELMNVSGMPAGRGSPGRQHRVALVVLDSTLVLDLAIPMQAFGKAAFTELRGQANPCGSEILVLAGFMTHMCVSSAARGAFELGYDGGCRRPRTRPLLVTGEVVSARVPAGREACRTRRPVRGGGARQFGDSRLICRPRRIEFVPAGDQHVETSIDDAWSWSSRRGPTCSTGSIREATARRH